VKYMVTGISVLSKFASDLRPRTLAKSSHMNDHNDTMGNIL
jgi:hypothetical protein